MNTIIRSLGGALFRIALVPAILASVFIFSGEMETVTTGAIQLIETLAHFSN